MLWSGDRHIDQSTLFIHEHFAHVGLAEQLLRVIQEFLGGGGFIVELWQSALVTAKVIRQLALCQPTLH